MVSLVDSIDKIRLLYIGNSDVLVVNSTYLNFIKFSRFLT